MRDMAVQAMKAIHREGVIHKDARYESTLFNPQIMGIMLIDLERSQLLDPSRQALATLEPNMRQRILQDKEQLMPRSYSSRSTYASASHDSAADLARVRGAFYVAKRQQVLIILCFCAFLPTPPLLFFMCVLL